MRKHWHELRRGSIDPVGDVLGWVMAVMTLCLTAAGQDCVALVQRQQRDQLEQGVHVIRDVMLANGFTEYVVRYEAIEPADQPKRILPKKWAPTIGYTPLGIAGPSMALWYNQGFFIWTFDEMNLKDVRPSFEMVRANGSDAAMVYRWDTPKARVSVHFAVVDSLDKLLMFGRFEPKTEIDRVSLKLMAYPGTFTKPWNRRVTTAERTVSEGAIDLDLDRETWVLLEDVTEGRPGAGPAGLLLGDTSAFASARVTGIGGYAEYVELELKPDRKEFVLGLYEMPAQPDVQAVRETFRKAADTESRSLAELVSVDLQQPLPTVNAADPERLARVRAAQAGLEKQQFERPAERWQPRQEPLPFPWLKTMSGPPIQAGLLCPRWAAYDTMEVARRLALEVRHQYFDTADDLVSARSWPYARYTGVGALNASLAIKNLMRICTADELEVMMIAGILPEAIPPDAFEGIVAGVRDEGRGLVLCGATRADWPDVFFETPAPDVVAPIAAAFPAWEQLPGLGQGGKGRVGDDFPIEAYRLGRGLVVLWRVNTPRYSAVAPAQVAFEGYISGTDATYALAGLAIHAAAGRTLPKHVTVTPPADNSRTLQVHWTGPAPADMMMRIRDDLDNTLYSEIVDPEGPVVLPSLPSGCVHTVDMILRDEQGRTVGVASNTLPTRDGVSITSFELTPGGRVHPEAVPAVPLPDGGTLRCAVTVNGNLPGDCLLRLTVADVFGRALGQREMLLAHPGVVRTTLDLLPAVTVCHRLDAVVLHDGVPIARGRQRFAVPIPYPYEEFTYLLWSYARREPITRRVQELSYDLGTDVMDLCHMRGYSDAQAAVEYDVASRSGLRLIPYITRIANETRPDRTLSPGLFNAAWIANQEASMRVCTRQAVPYRPAAYTLGDENYLARGGLEFGAAPEAMAAFRDWLRGTYGTVEALNRAWHTDFQSFDVIDHPVWLEDVREQADRMAGWFDHRRFYDEAFVALHERFANVVVEEDPKAKVGWDGLLRYASQSGYDFHRLCENLRLNQVYTTHPFQGELVRAFAGDGAFTGEWGNAIADNEAGFRAIAWHNLFRGHNSCWWWTSWGCDYTPFNPDTSLSTYGQWFFDEAKLLRRGIGRMILAGRRDDSGIAVLYNQLDLHAAHLAQQFAEGSAFAGDRNWIDNHTALTRLLADAGVQFTYIDVSTLEQDADALADTKVLILPLATCVSDAMADAVEAFVERGGSVIADGRAGLLDGRGALRDDRPLARLFGLDWPQGKDGFTAPSRKMTFGLAGVSLETAALEPDGRVTTAADQVMSGDTPVLVSRAVGRGRAHWLNMPFEVYSAVRDDVAGQALLAWFSGRLEQAAVLPYATLTTDSGPARRIEQTLFQDGPIRYLCLQQDLFWRTDQAQTVTVRLSRLGGTVVDVRTGETVAQGNGPWTTRLSRGTPKVFAILPYTVESLSVRPQTASATLGSVWRAAITVESDAEVRGRHIVHAGVFAPGAEQEHRQYSVNVACPQGQGVLTVPLALNDKAGTWRVVLRDAASGTTAEQRIEAHLPRD